MNKGQEFEVYITDMTEEGAGIGKVDGYPLFIKGAVPGDKVLVQVIKDKKTYGYGRVMKVLEPSPDRVEPLCPVSGPCGGCQLQTMSYEAQLKFKRERVQAVLERIGGMTDILVPPVIGMESPTHYRNKAEYPVRRGKDGRIVMGFYAGHSHNVIECENCYIGQETDGPVIKTVKDWMQENKISAYDEESGKGLMRHLMIRTSKDNGSILVCLVINGNKLPAAIDLVEGLRRVNSKITSISYCVNKANNNVIMGDRIEVLYGEAYLSDKIGDVEFRINPLSFYQVNPVQTEKLYGKALEFAGLTGKEKVWDLYCGIGTISLFLAKSAASVKGVEIVPAAIENARENAERNGIKNAEFFVGKAEEVLPEHYRRTGENADVIVVDPPRKGCDGVLLETMISMAPEKIVYVSCNPATLARDIKILGEGGYKVEKIQPVDMFPETVHVETVVLLSQQRPNDKIRVELDLTDFDITAAEKEATYQEIKDYIFEKHGVNVSSLYIAQVKEKLGIRERENYNLPKNADAKQPQCPIEKEKMIVEALKHFKMILE